MQLFHVGATVWLHHCQSVRMHERPTLVEQCSSRPASPLQTHFTHFATFLGRSSGLCVQAGGPKPRTCGLLREKMPRIGWLNRNRIPEALVYLPRWWFPTISTAVLLPGQTWLCMTLHNKVESGDTDHWLRDLLQHPGEQVSCTFVARWRPTSSWVEEKKQKTTARAVWGLIMKTNFLDLITSSAGASLQSGHAFICHP